MAQNFTLNDLAEFAQQEQDMFDSLNEKFHAEHERPRHFEPRLQVVNNILSFSQAFSVRDSGHLSKIEMVLN